MVAKEDGIKILIVDDNPDDIEITRIVLGEAGWEVALETAPCGEAACDRLRMGNDLPALILLDLKTPGMGGLDTLRWIRADTRLKQIPVIMVTASSFEKDEKEAYENGADAFLYKAFDIDQFSHDLDSLLQRFLK